MRPAAIWPQARWNGACANAKMISARADDRRRQRTRESLADAELGDQRRQRGDAHRHLRPLQHRDPRRRDQAFQRHLRGDAEHDHHHQRAQIAAAEQHQRARAAAVRQHHAVAEQHARRKTSAAPRTTAADRSICRDRRRRAPPATASRRSQPPSPAHRCAPAGCRPAPTSRAGCSSCRTRSAARPRHRRGRSADRQRMTMIGGGLAWLDSRVSPNTRRYHAGRRITRSRDEPATATKAALASSQRIDRAWP